MTALSAPAEVPRKLPDLQAFPVAATTTIYKGSHVCLNTSGYAVAGADTVGYRYVGIAYETADNSGGVAGDKSIRIHIDGAFLMTCTSITQAMVGRIMYLVDSGTVDESGVTAWIPVGILEEFKSTTQGWVRIKPLFDLIGYQDHVRINTDKADKTIRLNSKTFTDAASTIGVQTKPRAGVDETDDIIGMESMPGINDTFDGKGIVCFKAEPYFGSTGAAGALTGDVRGYETTLGLPAGVTSLAGVLAALKAINNSDKAPVGGIYVIQVPASGGGIPWSGLALLPDDGQIAKYNEDPTGGTVGWVKIKIGNYVGKIKVENLT